MGRDWFERIREAAGGEEKIVDYPLYSKKEDIGKGFSKSSWKNFLSELNIKLVSLPRLS